MPEMVMKYAFISFALFPLHRRDKNTALRLRSVTSVAQRMMSAQQKGQRAADLKGKAHFIFNFFKK
jgi:hypothetical protein